MPKYLDYHAKAPEFPPEAIQQTLDAIKAGTADEYGVKPINAFVTERGEAYCLTEAPSADAVCKSHALKGFDLTEGDVREVNSFV
jgi:hypothetical protein